MDEEFIFHILYLPPFACNSCSAWSELREWSHLACMKSFLFSFFLSFIELPFIEIPTPVISPASAPVPSPASWARLTKARLAEQVLGMPLCQKSILLVVSHSHTIWHQKRQYLIAQINWFVFRIWIVNIQIQKTKKGTLQNIQINHVSNMCVSKLLVLVANFYRPIYPLCCMRMFETNGGYKITPAEENYTIQPVSEITQIPPVTK